MVLFRRFFRERSRGHLFFALGLFLYAWMVAAFMPGILRDVSEYSRLLARCPRELLTLLAGSVGDLDAMFTPEGFICLEFFALWLPVILLGYGVGYGASLVAREVETGTIETLLSLPVSRTRLLAARIAALVAGLALLTAFTLAATHALAGAYGFDLDPAGTALAAVHIFGFVLAFVAFAVALSVALLDRGKAVGVTVGYFVFAHLVNALSTYSDAIRRIQFLSLFRYYDPYGALANAELNVYHTLLTYGLSAAFILAAVFIFGRRDILVS